MWFYLGPRSCKRKLQKLTNCSRGIRNAWHFYYALVLVIKVECSDIGIALLTP
ncbi:hypothetical protein B878_23843 [Vibrio campbellii CAIM 519 = NBRC 15631 = ATCC 25920]|nr:hypothetical protein B878_23843 [Vibrio campbellii CAIM 519 = NBRC 15631 = ATCC 25920]